MPYQDSPWPVPQDQPPRHLEDRAYPAPDRPSIRELTTPQQRRRATLGTIIGVVGFVVLLIAGNLLWAYCNPPTVNVNGASRPVVVPSTSMTPDVFSQLRSAFGPWEIVSDASSVQPRLVMLSPNGVVEASAYKLTYDNTWKATVSADIDAVEFYNTVSFRTTTGHVFKVAYNQIFVFASQPSMAYAFTRDKQLVGTPIGNLLRKGTN